MASRINRRLEAQDTQDGATRLVRPVRDDEVEGAPDRADGCQEGSYDARPEAMDGLQTLSGILAGSVGGSRRLGPSALCRGRRGERPRRARGGDGRLVLDAGVVAHREERHVGEWRGGAGGKREWAEAAGGRQKQAHDDGTDERQEISAMEGAMKGG